MGANWNHPERQPAPPQGGFSGGHPDASEFHFKGTRFSGFFEQFFGSHGCPSGGFGRTREDGAGGETLAQRGQDIEGDILVTLDEVLHGSTRMIHLQRADPHTGQSVTQTLRVEIPSGVREAQLIRLAGKGQAGSGGGDTDFSQTEHLDRWDDRPEVCFVFGIDAMPNRVTLAEGLPEGLWQPLHRPSKYEVRTEPRQRSANVKKRIVRERGYEDVHLQSEQVAEFDSRPTKCHKIYRIVVLRKNLSVAQGQQRLFDEIRCFFYISNDLAEAGKPCPYLTSAIRGPGANMR
ncbi:MAG: hypothetical protein KBE65_11655 [Phycisphaerae bacterium]|nr:hypothetical protein [Phycisphaerae bacterium]